MKRSSPLSKQTWLHLAGIIVFLSMPVLFSPDLFNTLAFFNIPPFQREFITYLMMVCFFYTSYLFIIPKLYLRRKWLPFILAVAVCLAIIVFTPHLIIPRERIHPHLMPNAFPPPHRNFSPLLWGHNLAFALAIFFLAFTLKMSNLWKRSQQEKLDAELSYLKAQINPHFLFNTLNSIYSLAISKSDLTASAIVKLSGMMRYVLSEAHLEMVSLQKETAYISDYIELQKLRLTENIQLNFTLTGNTTGKQIAPLLLIPFIENAFKFGINPEKPSTISIHIDVQESHVLLFIENSKVNDTAEKNGFGITNARSRLLLLYPGKHELTITDQESRFTVSLKLFFV